MIIQNIFFSFTLLFLLSCSQPVEQKTEDTPIAQKSDIAGSSQLLLKLEAEYAVIDTVAYLEAYIEKVIMVGSSGLGFPSGDMQGGFADVSDAQKIAHYVVTLSGKTCSDHQIAAKAQMYYTSNCGGCHGNDGKGLNGTFPDLTKPTLLGIQNRKVYLKFEIEKLKKQ